MRLAGRGGRCVVPASFAAGYAAGLFLMMPSAHWSNATFLPHLPCCLQTLVREALQTLACTQLL